MKTLIFIILFFAFCNNLFSQSQVDQYADSVYVLPDSLCLTCNGSVWQNPMNARNIPSGYTNAFLLPYNQCNQDTCYYTRELRFCKYGFSIPLNAIIDSFWVHIYQRALTQNAVVDTVVQLMKNFTPVGNNYAYPYPWLYNNPAYYNFGLFGTTWSAQEVNDTGFGVFIRAKNILNDTVTAYIINSHITVYYNTPNGVFSQTKEQNLFIIYPNPLTSSFILQFNTQVSNAEVVIYNMLGKEMLRKKLTVSSMQIEKGSLEGGVYFVKVENDGREYVQKIVVE